LSDAAKFAGYEAIFVAGGDQWSGRRLGISMFATLAAVRAHNNRIFAYPFSVNPRIGRYSSSQSLRQNFGNIRGPLVVRDSISKGVINQLGLPVVSGWDCVYGIQDLAYNIEPQPDRDATRTLLVITGRSPNLERSLRTLLKRLIPEVGPLELLTTCAPVDGKTYERLSAEFDIPSRLPMSWQETVAELKATAIVVTNRLHGLILGSFAEATLLPVTDRKKAEAFVRDAGLPYYACKLSDLSPALIRTAKANEVVILDKLKRYRDQSRKALLGPMFDPSLN
jgi:polysaccharide pyruvyl transferase WcaK-like protein